MKFTFFHNTPAWYRFFLSIFIVLSFSIISYILAIVISIPFFHLSINEVKNIFLNGKLPDNVLFLKYLQAFQSFGSFLLPAFFLAWLFSGNAYKYLEINKPVYAYSTILIALSVLAAIPLINFTGFLNSKIGLPDSLNKIEEIFQKLEESYMELLKSFLNTSSLCGYFLNLFIIAILPAVCEELLFRGVFQRVLIDWTKNKHIGIIITATLFSIMHLHYNGLIPRFLLGVYFGYLLIWSGSLWLPILAHFINNAFAVTFYHFSGGSPGNSVVDNLGGADGNLLPLFISIFLFTLFAFSIYLTERMQQLRPK